MTDAALATPTAESHRTQLEALSQKLQVELQRHLPESRELRHRLHADPRVSGDESDTARTVAEALRGVLDLSTVADVGLVGRIGPEGPAVGLRAELDALPVKEKTGADFAAMNGAMHACGHDVHMAALVALSKAAAGLKLPVALAPVFQPREEAYPSGAEQIVDEGVLRRFGIAQMAAAHVHPAVAPGSVAVGSGYINAAADEISIRLDGQGGHGAYPHHGFDTVTAISQIAIGLQETLRRTVSPMNPAVISVGTLAAGEGAANVLPKHAHLLAIMRTVTAEDRTSLFEAVRSLAEGTAAAYGLTAEVTLTMGEPVLDNDERLATSTEHWVKSMGLDVDEPMRSLGADDFSFFCQEIPSLMTFVGIDLDEATSSQVSLHDPEFLPTEHSVGHVAHALLAAYLGGAERILEDRRV